MLYMLNLDTVKSKLNAWDNYFSENEEAVGVIEIVLILVVLISLVIIFKDNIKTLMNSIMSQINSSATSVWKK